MTHMARLSAVVVAVAGILGCGGGGGAAPTCQTIVCPTGFECSAATESCQKASGLMAWTLTDSCADGVGIQIRFFDTTNGLHWPADPTQVYKGLDGVAGEVDLACLPGATVCYGAEPDPSDGRSWGMSLDGTHGCPACCSTCGASPSIGLTCN